MNNELGFIQKLTRLYTFYSPIKRGKYRLALTSLGLEKELPARVVAKTTDGRTLKINFDNHFAHFIYFIGEYERAVTNVIRSIIKPGDVCFDIGANVGWYTTLLQTLVGERGEVHSFEPVPQTFHLLEENVGANANSTIVSLNNFALGEESGAVNLHVFSDLPDGHSSISDHGHTDFDVLSCRVSTIDEYLGEAKIDIVNFVKADIEGAELMMLKGAGRFFAQDIPPIFEIEMALDTTRGFGYLPNDIIEFISKQREYEFFAINETTSSLNKIANIEPHAAGANVLCIPLGHYSDRLRDLRRGD